MTFLSTAQNLPTPLPDESPPPTRESILISRFLCSWGSHVAQPSPMPCWLECGSLYTECPKAAGTKVQVSASGAGVGSMSSGLGAPLAGMSPSGQAFDLICFVLFLRMKPPSRCLCLSEILQARLLPWLLDDSAAHAIVWKLQQ